MSFVLKTAETDQAVTNASVQLRWNPANTLTMLKGLAKVINITEHSGEWAHQAPSVVLEEGHQGKRRGRAIRAHFAGKENQHVG